VALLLLLLLWPPPPLPPPLLLLLCVYDCAEVDGCSPNNCSIPGSDGTCQDNLAPLTGYRCVCTAGYVWNQATNQCISKYLS
jgi:hypothetical protein